MTCIARWTKSRTGGFWLLSGPVSRACLVPVTVKLFSLSQPRTLSWQWPYALHWDKGMLFESSHICPLSTVDTHCLCRIEIQDPFPVFPSDFLLIFPNQRRCSESLSTLQVKCPSVEALLWNRSLWIWLLLPIAASQGPSVHLSIVGEWWAVSESESVSKDAFWCGTYTFRLIFPFLDCLQLFP